MFEALFCITLLALVLSQFLPEDDEPENQQAHDRSSTIPHTWRPGKRLSPTAGINRYCA